jgi:N-acetylglutamate synthase-like GNAT family acetyltransferase
MKSRVRKQTDYIVRLVTSTDSRDIERLIATAHNVDGSVSDIANHAALHFSRSCDRQHQGEAFWIAENDHRVVGCIGVEVHSPGVANVSHFGVALPAGRDPRELAETLLLTAFEHCRRFAFVKVLVTCPVARKWTMDVASRQAFQYARRARSGCGIEFYVNLYFDPAREATNATDGTNACSAVMDQDPAPDMAAHLERKLIRALAARCGKWCHPALDRAVHKLVVMLQQRTELPVQQWTNHVQAVLREHCGPAWEGACDAVDDQQIERLTNVAVSKLDQLRRIANRRGMWIQPTSVWYG